MAPLPTCGPLLILSPALEYWEPPPPPHGTGHEATGPPFGPLLILSLAPKSWGACTRQGLCSQCNHLWKISDFVPRSEALGPPLMAVHAPAPLVGHL